ncbi:MAG TPA: hypothetical protein VFC42_04130 [Methylomirabilota bacterium]|nr:hypothetical protein [Methylomirabilota bacterium]
MTFNSRVGVVFLIAIAAVACAANKPQPPNLTSGGAVLFSVHVEHAVKPEYAPTELRLALLPEPPPRPKTFGEDVTEAYQHRFTPSQHDGAGTDFLVLIPALPGAYKVIDLRGHASKFPIIATFELPVTGTVSVKQGQVMYLGRITAKTRARRDGERRAGPVLPAIDQAVSGYASSTWDIDVMDQRQTDVAAIQSQFPSLGTVETSTVLLQREQ